MRIKKPPQSSKIHNQIAVVKLRAEQVKLKSLAYTLKLKANKKQAEEDRRLDKSRELISDFKDECFTAEIEHLQNRLNNALREIQELRNDQY